MCDYSLHAIAARPAEAAEMLVSTRFQTGGTGGFASLQNMQVAVCLPPGTEVAFEEDAQTGMRETIDAGQGPEQPVGTISCRLAGNAILCRNGTTAIQATKVQLGDQLLLHRDQTG